MKKLLFAFLLMTGAAVADDGTPADAVVPPANPFTGWHWYNEPKKPPSRPAPRPRAAPPADTGLQPAVPH